MAGIRLEWSQFGDFDSFDIIRSTSPMDIAVLPSPIATNLPTMYYVDTSIVEGATYYYRVRTWREAISLVGDEVLIKAESGDEYWSDVVALLHFDSNLTDEVGNVFTSYGTINFNSGVFGQCATFSGSNYISAANGNDFDFLLGDFTVEQFVNFATLPSGGVFSIVGNYQNNDGWVMQLRGDEGRGMRLRFSMGDVNYVDRAWTPSLGTWYHLAVTRQSGLVYIFVDGVLQGDSALQAANAQAASGSKLNIGALSYISSTIQYFNGSVDELRITKGVARYTADFIPPEAAFKGR